MAKASINFQVATRNSLEHMFRNSQVTYLLENENSNNQYKHFLNADDFLEQAKIITKEKTKRGMQKLAIDNFVQEAVLNIKEDTTIEDVQNLFKKFNNEFGGGFEIFDIALHFDEGVFIDTKYNINELTWDSKNLKWLLEDEEVTNEVFSIAPGRDIFYNSENKKWYKEKLFKNEVDISKYQKFYNYHSHIRFTRFDKNRGKNVRLSKSDYSKIQDITAEQLGMQRGDKWSKNKRMTHWQRKELTSKNEKQKNEALAKQKDLKSEISKLRAELKKAGAVRSDYAKLEQIAKELKIQVNEKELTINSLEHQLTNARETILVKNELIDTLKKSKEYTEKIAGDYIENYSYSDEEYKTLENNLSEAHKTILIQKTSISTLKAEKELLKQSMEDLEVNNKQLKKFISWYENVFIEFNNLLKKPMNNLLDIVEAIKDKLIEPNIKEDTKRLNQNLNPSESTENTFTKQQSEAIKKREENDTKNTNKKTSIFRRRRL